jgi:hypothetical protein
VKPPSPAELLDVRELAEITLLDHALRVLDAVILCEHPTIDDPHPADPPSLVAARRLLAASRALRLELCRYHLAALDALAGYRDEIPF